MQIVPLTRKSLVLLLVVAALLATQTAAWALGTSGPGCVGCQIAPQTIVAPRNHIPARSLLLWSSGELRPPAPPQQVYVAPTRLPRSDAPAAVGSCYAEPGTPPAYILSRESGGNPRDVNPYSGASGCWQFMDGTWGGFGGYAKASDAPVSVQNERAKQVWAGGAGCSNWEQTADEC